MAQPLTETAHEIVAHAIAKGDTVVDATVGNGFDTRFLANAVSETGTVYGFDVQDIAIRNAKVLVGAGNPQIKWIVEDHAKLSSRIDAGDRGQLSAVMFNLGYLPGSDQRQTTIAGSTIRALKDAVEMIKPTGIVSVIAYRGHPGGPEEFAAVQQFLQTLDRLRYRIRTIGQVGENERSPVLFIVKKTAAPHAAELDFE